MSEFSPVQLDALEDALEDLELSGIPSELEDDAAVVGRLDAYRDLLQLSRGALPMVEVRAGVLDGVLEAARADASSSVAGAAVPGTESADAEAAAPWWKRWSLWIPALAVGASAALVLVVVRSTLSSDAEPAPSTVARADDASVESAAAKQAASAEPLLEKKDELQAAAAAEDAPADDGLGLGGLETRGRLRGSAAGGNIGNKEAPAPQADPATAADEAPEEEEVQREPTDKVIYDGEAEKAGKGSGGSSSKKSKRASGPKDAVPGGAAPAPAPAKADKPKEPPAAKPKAEPKPESKSKNDSNSKSNSDSKTEVGPQEADKLLAAADSSRRTGKCGSARSTYRSLIDHANKRIRSRALAGLGLCALSAGDSKAADAFFSRARKADPSIGSFIAAERDEEPAAQQSL